VAGEWSGSPNWGLTSGVVVAGYRVEERIGAGGMAVVFRAKDMGLGRTVALKILAPALTGDREFRDRFIRESRAAAAVDHPHIIPVYAAGEAEGVLYIAMRYVSSGDLRALIRRDGQQTAERASRLLSPLASALDAGHLAGLVHRDVKPANILIDTGARIADHPYLADFGLAKGSGSTAGLTGTGEFLGTLDYAAPEQISGKRPVPQTDQYALACAAFTMLTGVAPFPREEPMAVLWAHMSEPPPSVTALRPDLPRGIDQVLARAMAKTPEERYRTCGEFAEAFRTALGVGTMGIGAYSPTERTLGLPSLTFADPATTGAAGPGAMPPPWLSVLAADLPASRVSPDWPVSASDWPVSASHTDTVTSLPPGGGPRHAGVRSEGPGLAADIAAPGGRGGGARDKKVGLTRRRPAGRWKGRRRALIIATVASVVVVGGGGALLAVHPWLQPPVLRPAGLAVQGKTTSSLTIDWSAPATGPLPDTYEILSNGTQIGTVPGTTTHYTASGLAPDSPYHFQVIAVRGGEQSPASLPLTGQTVAPPLSDARFDWSNSITYTMESLTPPDADWDKQPGNSWQDPWSFTPTCSSGPCDATLNGAYSGWPFTSTLTRSGSTYYGTAQIKGYLYCVTESNAIVGTLTIQITANSAAAQGTQWVVKSFSGTATFYEPSAYTCHSDTAQLTVTSGSAG
jgi:serine/threonine protein kinase